MERMLVLCGIIIIIIPKWFKESYFGSQKKYCLSTQIIGVFTTLLGGLYFLDKIEKGNFLCIILYGLLLAWNVALLWNKIKMERGMISKTMCIVNIVLILSSIIILYDIQEIASSIVILTCTLISVSIPYTNLNKD